MAGSGTAAAPQAAWRSIQRHNESGGTRADSRQGEKVIMKKWIPLILVVVMAGWALSGLRQPPETGFHTRDFGKLPVLMNGRFQPFDSVARNSLLQIRTKQTVLIEENGGTRDAVRHGLAARSDDETGVGRRPENFPH